MKTKVFATISVFLIAWQFTGCVSAFKTTSINEPIVEARIVEKSGEDLYVISNSWLVSIFKNSESVIEFSDKEEGTIIGKYLIRDPLLSAANTIIDPALYAKITINTKDGKARISIQVLNSWKYHPNVSYNKADYNNIDAKNDIDNLINSFFVYLEDNNNNDNW